MSFCVCRVITIIIDHIEKIKNIAEISFFICTIIVAFKGLKTWRIHLRGGDLYTYSKEALLELRKLIDLFTAYRYIFTPKDEEKILWIKIHEQYLFYKNKIENIRILSKNKFNDKIGGENMEDILTSFMKLIYEMQSLYEERNLGLDSDGRKRNGERMKDIYYILKNKEKGDDDFSLKLENYYNGLSKKLIKYL